MAPDRPALCDGGIEISLDVFEAAYQAWRERYAKKAA